MATLRLLAALLCGGLAVSAWQPEAGNPFVRSFTPRVYGASPQNWAAVQDRRGVLYIGNTEGILEYDGVAWRRIPVSNRTPVRSLAVDEKGTLFAGAQGDFGYLEANGTGTLQFVSLLQGLPANARKFGDVWTILPMPDGVYFGSYEAIFRWTRGAKDIRVWKPRARFGRLLMASGTLYVVSEGEGLLSMKGESFAQVPGGQDFKRPGEVRGLRTTPGGLEVIERTRISRWDGQAFRKTSTAIDALLQQTTVYTAQALADGSLALATARGGLILLNPDGQVERIFNKEAGLLSDYLTNIYIDREGALWLTSNAGIEQVNTTMTRYSAAEGLNGNVSSLVRYEGRLYAGTDVGLFHLKASRGEVPHFEALKDFRQSVIPLVPSSHGLLVGAVSGVHVVAGDRESLLLPSDVIYDIVLSGQSTAWAAGRAGLFELQWDGVRWTKGRSMASGGQEFRSVVVDPDGRIWVGGSGFLLRVRWEGDNAVTERFAADRGVPSGFNNVYLYRGAVVFATAKGLLRFDGARFVAADVPGIAGRPVSIIRESPDGSTWITGEGYHGRFAGNKVLPMPLLRSEAGELYTVFPEQDGTVWAAGADGFLIRYETPRQPSTVPMNVLLRRVQPQNGDSVFGGGGALPGEPRLPWRDNTLRFEFAAPFFEDPAKVEYQVRLDGADADWSRWSSEPRKDYTHLFEGGYSFEVRARNPHGEVSPVASFGFGIAPPWYRTWGAWILWVLLAAAGLYGVYRWRIRNLVQEKEKLEVIVEERTVEIRQQRDQIQVEQERSESLLLNILPASVATELKATGIVQPQNYDEVTVCFTDFVGFTLSSQEMAAGELVSSLHEYFTYFDEIVEEFGLEKLKTIGDAYMLVSGLPRPRRAHAVDAVLAALRMVEAVRELAGRGEGAVWGVRVGLNSGPVAAGVVGVRKFAYDIWGNTVNLASRMESSGVPGEVNLSASTYELVREFIECEPRGLVQTKDKRDLEMYLARGVRRELAEPEAFGALYRERFGEEPVSLTVAQPG